ncbi:hypothetical protein [Caldivirga sp.]|uniref:hypothetical protein n=1 Tax=Caldivirga sp. TaxID=2080243 RepID=UPI003D0C8B41
MFNIKQIKLGLEEWKKLENELKRIGDSEKLELVLNMVMVPVTEENNENEEEESEEHHHMAPPEFTEDLSKLVDSIKSEYNANADYHSHGDHGELMVALITEGGSIPGVVRGIIEEARNCESCMIHSIDGEVHLGDDVSVIMFGDSYKLTVILPGQDGRRLVIMELNV